jgi:hypothetical protein
MRKKQPSLAPGFVVKRTKMQGKRVLEVKTDKNAILVTEKQKEQPSEKEDCDGYSRTRVFDSWEY